MSMFAPRQNPVKICVMTTTHEKGRYFHYYLIKTRVKSEGSPILAWKESKSEHADEMKIGCIKALDCRSVRIEDVENHHVFHLTRTLHSMRLLLSLPRASFLPILGGININPECMAGSLETIEDGKVDKFYPTVYTNF